MIAFILLAPLSSLANAQTFGSCDDYKKACIDAAVKSGSSAGKASLDFILFIELR
jgi:hypothetical protein